MKDRINKIIARENLTPSKFADIIGVQRSGVSHILSGRNNPGLDFLNKILQHFPHISGDWLITGQGGMLKLPTGANKIQSLFDTKPVAEKEQDTSVTSKTEVNPQPIVNQPLVVAPIKMPDNKEQEAFNHGIVPQTSPRSIERILVFYTDRTFHEYLPQKDD